MPILSYLAYPVAGQNLQLARDLRLIDGCTVHEPEAGEVLVLVTETADESEEKKLRARLEAVESLLCLAMVFGHRDGEPGGLVDREGSAT